MAVQLDTLFGIPAAKRRIASTLHLSPTAPRFSQWPGWKFGVSDPTRSDTKKIELADGQTDEKGHATLPLNLEAHTAPMLRAGGGVGRL